MRFARLIGVRSAKGLALALQGLGLSEDQFAYLVRAEGSGKSWEGDNACDYVTYSRRF